MSQMLVQKPIEYAKSLGIDVSEHIGLGNELVRIRAQIAPEIDRLIADHETNPELRSILLKAIPREGGHRGPLVYIVSSSNGNKPDLILSAASELFYWADAGLDDVADGNTFRQSAISIRKMFDDTTALYVSNVLYGIALEGVVTQFRDNPHKFREITEAFARRLHIVSRGQAVDMLATKKSLEEIRTDDYLKLVEETTGVDVGLNMKIGAISARLDPQTTENLYQFGFRLGTLAQIRDDVLDYCDAKDSEGNYIIGKLPFRDIESGKRRLPLLLTKDSNLRRIPDKVYDKIESYFIEPRREEAKKYLGSVNISRESRDLLGKILNYWSDIRLFQKIM